MDLKIVQNQLVQLRYCVSNLQGLRVTKKKQLHLLTRAKFEGIVAAKGISKKMLKAFEEANSNVYAVSQDADADANEKYED